MLEDELQRTVVEYIALAHPRLWPVTFHSPSGLAARSKTQVRRFIGLGFKPGVPDLLMLSLRRRHDEPARYYGGLALELKAGRNTPTEPQFAFLRALAVNGFYSTWTADLDAALAIIAAFAALPAPGDQSTVPGWAILVLERFAEVHGV
jgi:hypothetical protein